MNEKHDLQLWVFCIGKKEYTPLVRCLKCEQHKNLKIVLGVPVVECELQDNYAGALVMDPTVTSG